ncbi:MULTISPECIES: hypothetical protein [Rhodanobacter]|uniref:hypothetical protein n=2 Tax=Rhodanobacteraceae TaxID=1775411 RepID=UPI00041F3355|nr:hypothetical protein [Rhodanobacter thiooxydans]UJJ54031.1 hypothetical protein LRK53_13840 [Rhodanobacter thiooxydans]
MMKSRKPLLSALAAGTLLFAGSLIAQQDMPPQTPPPSPTDTAPQPLPPQTVPPTPPAAGTAAAAPTSQVDTATMNTPAGQLEVRSSMPPPPPAGPAPSFEQLSGGGKYISEEQASAYPLLANDFLHADRNRDGRISKSEYKRWTDDK